MRNEKSIAKSLVVAVALAVSDCQWCLAGDPDSGAEECRRQLQTIYAAIDQYRHQHRALPDRLTDLVPERLSPQSLICPLQNHANGPAQAAACTFSYEFEEKLMTSGLGAQLGFTLRSWRQLQMGKIGSKVPIVRCLQHTPALNLGFDGQIYASALDWENSFTNVVTRQELSFESLLMEKFRMRVISIPERDPTTPKESIDLTQHYNESLRDLMERAELRSLETLSGAGETSFDLRGLLQLSSNNHSMLQYPVVSDDIRIDRPCRSLLFLQGAAFEEAEGMLIGEYQVHFQDGTEVTHPVRYGQDVKQWTEAKAPASHGQQQFKWEGQSVTGAKQAVYLYTSRWINPRPTVAISHLSFRSTMNHSAPFLVALIAEPAPPPSDETK